MDMSHGADTTKWVTVTEAAQLLGKSARTVQRWADTGRLPVTRHGRRVLVDIGAEHYVIDGEDVDRGGQIGVDDTSSAAPPDATDRDMSAEVADLAVELAHVKVQLEQMTRTCEDTRQERDYWRQVATREQELHAMTLNQKRIEGPRGSWWARLFGGPDS